MRFREAIASALQLFVILFDFGLALFFVILARRLDWRSLGIHWLQDEPEYFYWIGAAVGCLGILLMLGFYGVGRGRFLRLAMKPHIAMIDIKLLQKATEECFQTHFSPQVRGSDIAIFSKQRLEVAVDLAPMESRIQIVLLKDMEQKLTTLLRDRFGYTRPFTVSIHSK